MTQVITIYSIYMCNLIAVILPQTEKARPVTPKPLNIDIGQSFESNGSIETLKKSPYTATLLSSFFTNIGKRNVAV